jgi:integrase
VQQAASDMLKRTNPNISVHGFRSTFSTWVAEETDTPEDIREAALGHFNRDRVAAAYQRGDLLEKRRRLMERWGNFCISATVVQLRSAAGMTLS